MRELGIDAFRFSIAWPRVLPTGRGAVNEEGLDFYDRLVDELLGNGITPFATLFHWDTAAAARGRGRLAGARDRRGVRRVRRGRRRRGSATASATGSRTTSRGSSRGSATAGAITRRAARRDADALAAAHHLLLSHGRAVEILRARVARRGGRDHAQPRPRRTRRRDPTRTRRPRSGSTASTTAGSSTRSSAASYPEDMLEAWPAIAPPIEDGDLEAIAAPIDFLGVNNYTSPLVARRTGGEPLAIVRRADVDRTDMGWEVYPDGLCDAARAPAPRLRAAGDLRHARTAPPSRTCAATTAACDDPERQAYLEAHIGGGRRGRSTAGAPVRGYFVWSLLDNFEWA